MISLDSKYSRFTLKILFILLNVSLLTYCIYNAIENMNYLEIRASIEEDEEILVIIPIYRIVYLIITILVILVYIIGVIGIIRENKCLVLFNGIFFAFLDSCLLILLIGRLNEKFTPIAVVVTLA